MMVHLEHGGGVSVCKQGIQNPVALTREKEAVTCGRCRRTLAWKTSLPSKTSVLLRTAVHDARGLDRSRYYPDAALYYAPNRATNVCHVCLAGACLVGTMRMKWSGPEWSSEFHIVDVSSDLKRKLQAIDCFRAGLYEDAFRRLDVPFTKAIIQRLYKVVPEPRQYQFLGWRQFDEHLLDIEKLAETLEELGM